MNQLARFGLILGAICLVATTVLALTYEVTKPKIEAELREEERSALRAVMPEADSFEKKELDGVEYFEALKGGAKAGYCVRVVGAGYGGFIRMIVGVNKDGVIEGIRVLEHTETPGLGAKINEVRPGETEPWFLRQYKGKTADKIVVKQNIDAITGATISSKAVSDAVSGTIDRFLERAGK